MFARLGRVVYWASCLIACCLIAGGVAGGISGSSEAFALSLVSIPVYLFGLACLYIFSNETPKWHRMEKVMALVATLGVASFSIVTINSQLATPAWMDDPIVEESAGSEKTSLNEEEGTIIYEEVDYDPFVGEKSEKKFYLDPMPLEELKTIAREVERTPRQEREKILNTLMGEKLEGMTDEELAIRLEILRKFLEIKKQEQEQESQR